MELPLSTAVMEQWCSIPLPLGTSFQTIPAELLDLSHAPPPPTPQLSIAHMTPTPLSATISCAVLFVFLYHCY